MYSQCTFQYSSLGKSLFAYTLFDSNLQVFSFIGGKKQIDSVLNTFEYFRRKSKEREEELQKSYNDRSYLSSEDVGPGESRTGTCGAPAYK